jgi:hypothetical protein
VLKLVRSVADKRRVAVTATISLRRRPRQQLSHHLYTVLEILFTVGLVDFANAAFGLASLEQNRA